MAVSVSVQERRNFMQTTHPALTCGDHAKLERLMCTLSGSRAPIADLTRRKLETAVIIHPETASDDLVMSGRKVRYSVNGTPEIERLLTWERFETARVPTLSLQQPLGLALLGLRTGESIAFTTDAGIATAEVTSVSIDPIPSPLTDTSKTLSKLHVVAATIRRYAQSALARLQKGRTEAALLRLSNDTLKDIGITRGEIPYVARMVAGLPHVPTNSRRSAGRPEEKVSGVTLDRTPSDSSSTSWCEP
jgi:uncharacterized protein YjiS (DUF1127 family)